MTLTDPRWTFVLHMNWKSQMVPVLVNGLPTKKQVAASADKDEKHYYSLPQPDSDQIVPISPYAQILNGTYRTPTFFVHGTRDDLIPLRQSEKAWKALVERGVESGIYRLEGADHLFDFFRDRSQNGPEAIQAGYNWLADHV